MYLQYFGLSEPPFSITPDPRFVYLSSRHEDALAHLQYGIGQGGSGGFVQLTGEVGTGKTTLCRTLLEQLPDNARVALILNPALGPIELLESICQEFKISLDGIQGSIKLLVDRLNEFLLATHAEGNTAVLLVDEAQNLSPASLEQVRLLTNLETETKKLLQIILLGQPELRDVLARPDLRQLAQRVTARYHLRPLSGAETAIYVDHRLMVAGCPDSPFTPAGHRALHKQSGGIPRLINIIAERALLAAYAKGQRQIGRRLVGAAAQEVRGEQPGPANWPGRLALVSLLLAITAATWWWQRGKPGQVINSDVAAAVDTMRSAAATKPTGEHGQAIDAEATKLTPAATAQAIEPEVDLPTDDLTDVAMAFPAAWRLLLSQRGIPTVALSGTDCQRRVASGVYCLQQRAGLQQLERLQRPVLLELPAYNGFVVASVSGDGTMVWTETGARPIATFELARQWNGRYWDIWAMPGYVPDLLREGERGPGVLWVKSAAAADGYAGDPEDPYFGPALKAWAIDFQQRVGVKADGLIGPQTLQHLTATRGAADDNS